VQSLYTFCHLSGATQLLANSTHCLGHRVSSAPAPSQISNVCHRYRADLPALPLMSADQPLMRDLGNVDRQELAR
jgi:hypothetical protein